MAMIDLDGIALGYEVIGSGPRTAVITPGGRFSKDTPGVRELGQALAEGGMRVLIWDRPNCGESDVSFAGESESIMNADALAGVLRKLDVAPAMLIGGSAGSRVSLIAAQRHPEAVRSLFLLWISGGATGLATLVNTYCGEAVVAAAMGGMKAVAAQHWWKEGQERNPGNRARILAQDVDQFIDTMQRWGWSFYPQENAPVPGLLPADFARMTMPVMILRSGQSDVHHPRYTSEEVHRLIPGSQIAEPPWGDREWLERMAAAARGEGLFANWPRLAPQILAFDTASG